MIKNRQAIVALLTALNLVNYVDRYLVSAVAPHIQGELKLSSAEIGAVTSAFMLGYFMTSPIFGWLGDKLPRKWLIAFGVLVWSAATMASGSSTSFATMIATRIFVGVGEASYATLSPTIIDDIASPAQKNRLLAIFYVAIPVGSALGFVLGGWLDATYGWRSAFYIAGGPGAVLAIAMLFIREPEKAVVVHADHDLVGGDYRDAPKREHHAPAVSYRDLLKYPVYRATVLGYVAQTFALGGFTAWAATFLYRRMCMELEVGDRYFGIITVITGLVGTFAGGFIADRWPGEDRTRAALAVCAWSSFIAAPLALVALLAPSAPVFLAAMGLCELALFASVGPTNVAVLQSVRPEARARAMAASIFMIHFLGDLPSPPIVGVVSDALHDAAERCSGAPGLRDGMLLLPFAIALSGVFWWRGSRLPAAPDALSTN